MIDTTRQLPSPSASAWAIDLTSVGGPVFAVLRLDEGEARAALVDHLLDIGSFATREETQRVVAAAPITSVGVIW